MSQPLTGFGLSRGPAARAFFIFNWIRDILREKLERVYAGLAEQGVISAAVEVTYTLDKFRAALAHAQRTERSGKILFNPSRPAAKASRAAGAAVEDPVVGLRHGHLAAARCSSACSRDAMDRQRDARRGETPRRAE